MPQFDKITFFNQVCWLLIFYFCAYFLFLKYFLPKIAKTLKIRVKKFQNGSQGTSSYNSEQVLIATKFNEAVFANTILIKEAIFEVERNINGWRFNIVTTINNNFNRLFESWLLNKLLMIKYLLIWVKTFKVKSKKPSKVKN